MLTSRKMAWGGSVRAVFGVGWGILNRPLWVEWLVCNGKLYEISWGVL